jgi:uncharacterized membrane protein
MTVFVLILVLLALLYGAAKTNLNPIKTLRNNAVATGLTFIFTGASHFFAPDKFMEIMPPFIPAPLLMVYASGVFEILGGIGLIIPSTRRAAALGLILLLLAVFPANIYTALNNIQLGGFMSHPVYQWLRLPMQIGLIWWIWWITNSKRKDSAI